MDEDPILGARARRAIPLIAAAMAVAIVLGLVYLRPPAKPSGAALTFPTPPSLDSQSWPAFDFVTPSLGWAAIVRPGTNTVLVYRTRDGAKSWQKLFAATVPEAQNPTIQFFDQDHGLVFAGRLYRTSDGGAQWDVISLPDATPYFTFDTPTIGWAVDEGVPSGTVFATRDGGLTWRSVGSAPDTAYSGKGGSGLIDFRADGEGWTGANAAGPTVYATFDGGSAWRAIRLPVPHIPVTDPTPGKPYLVDYTTSIRLLPGGGVLVEADSPTRADFYISLDRGLTWTPIPPVPSPASLGDLSFVDAKHWWASRWSILFKTSDAGRTWKSVRTVVPGYLGDWQFDRAQVIDAGHAWLTMRLSSARAPAVTGLATSADGGVSWNPVNVPKPG
jgi:hypothetical protein